MNIPYERERIETKILEDSCYSKNQETSRVVSIPTFFLLLLPQRLNERKEKNTTKCLYIKMNFLL